MSVINKEMAMMNSLFYVLSEIDNDKDFIVQLRDELQEYDLKYILNSADKKTQELFKEPFSINEIKEYLREVNDTFEKISEQINTDFMNKLEVFENSDFLKNFFLSEFKMFELENHNSFAYIEEYSDSVLRKITFDNSEICFNGKTLPNGTLDICYDTIVLNEESGSYFFEITNYLADEHYRIRFDNISVLLKAYNAESDPLFWMGINTPWDYVTALANSINSHFNYGIANLKEKKIFGLIKHLMCEKYIDTDTIPAELYHLIEKHNLKNVIKPPYDLTKPYLCKKKFEPFWRDVLNLISESQKDLPSYFDETVSKNDFEKHKQLITEQMKKWGYEGTYPDYYKKDSIIKPTLFRTYNLSHIVAFEKYVEHHIHCYSFMKRNDVIQTAFFIGTIFNKSDEEKSDIYSTMFDCNGRAVFSVESTIFAGAMNAGTYESWTTNAVKAAVRKADLKKSDKQDFYFKSIFERNPVLNFKGLLFAFVLFSVGFSLIVPLLLIILEGNTIPEVIAFLKTEPFLMVIGILGGFLATFLTALLEWISSKK